MFLPVMHEELFVEATMPEAVLAILIDIAIEGEAVVSVIGLWLTIDGHRKGAISCRTDNHRTIMELEDAADTGLNASWEMIVAERLGSRFKTVEASVSAYPYMAVTVAQQTDHHINTEGCRVGIMMEEGLEVIAVETVKPVVSSYPDAALLILAEVGNKTI